MMTQTTQLQPPTAAARALFDGIIDYAGLFPPSQVSMAEAVLNYTTYKYSNFSRLLGRFIVPVSRLDEFLETAHDFVVRDAKSGWRVSVIAGEDAHETVRRIEEFNAEHASFVLCDTVEIKANTVSKIENIAKILPDYVTAYFEIPTDARLADLVPALAHYRQRAKIRTGGVTADAFPATGDIIRFIRTCVSAKVPFKATAGLHHPMRCFKPLTYEANAPEGTMHGFLNIFLATGFARQGFKPELLESLIEDEFAESFGFSDGGITWHQDYILTVADIVKLRTDGIISFGSCSFDEPIHDLQEIGLL